MAEATDAARLLGEKGQKDTSTLKTRPNMVMRDKYFIKASVEANLLVSKPHRSTQKRHAIHGRKEPGTPRTGALPAINLLAVTGEEAHPKNNTPSSNVLCIRQYVDTPSFS
eukprot:gb/GECG01016328.1/.p1 GENE.gb/GECG01016328.1/~~gb/GECG01016328.1/.p1  ORF type:complete len:111 (+),score=11.70 gb/GECG01016328.1/:1-333(+)